MMKKTETEAGSTGCASAKVLRRLTGVAVVLMVLCLVLSAPAVAEDNVFINVLTAPEVLVQGTSADFVINAEAADAGIQWYIFGPNVFKYGAVTTADEGTSTQFTVALSEGTTTGMAAGQYFAVYQHPMFDQEFQITADGTNIKLDGTKIFNVEDYQAADAAQALCNALDTQTIDDLYVMYSFSVVEQAESTSHTCSDDSITDWQELTSIYSLTSSGNYYLTDDIEASSTIYVYGTVNLCLNGHTISLADGQTGSVINIGSNAVLNLYDCVGTGKITGGNATGNSGGGVDVSFGTFNMYGGSITGNQNTGTYFTDGGGGVSLYLGTFNMYGGTITKNTAYNAGGGVFSQYSGSIINLYDGTISENFVLNGEGGGVFLLNGGHFNMYGGKISENNATRTDYNYAYGGGVALDGDAVFNMTGGIISGNTAGYGAGVNTGNSGFLFMNGGLISDNIADTGGGVVGNILLYGGNITNNTAIYSGGGVHGNLTMYGGTIAENTADTGGGHHGEGMLIGGNITENTAYNGAGIATNRYGFTISGGNISYNKPGSSVWVSPDGGDNSTLTMIGGSIVYTAGYSNYGVSVSDGGSFNMSGGSIIDVLESEWDSAAESNVDVYYEVYDGVEYYGNFTTSGGTFSHAVSDEYIASGYACYEERGLYVVKPLGYTPLPDEPTPTPTPEPTPVEEIIVRSAADLADVPNVVVSGNVVTLTQDVTLVNPIRIYLNAGEEIILTTAGDYSLYRGVADNYLITVQRGTLTLKGKDSANQLTIDGRKDIYTENTDGLIYVRSGGCLNLSDNAILTNNAADSGAGVNVGTNGHFEMHGGEISNNYARYAGAGVYVSGEFADYDSEGQVTNVKYGYFNMSGGRICNNDGDGLFNYGITTISGGEISNNTDGIISAGGELIMTGGTIRSNTYDGVTLFDGRIGEYVDGDIVYRDTIGKLFISGDMVIPASECVWIGDNSTIIVTGPLSANAGIYNIQTSKESGVIVNATDAKIPGEDLLSHFVLNEDGYSLTANGYTLVLSPASTDPTHTLNLQLSKTSVNKGDMLRISGETTLPAETNLTLGLVAGNIQDEDAEVVDAFFLYVQEGDAEMNLWSTAYDTSALEPGEYFFIIFSTDNTDIVSNTASFIVSEVTVPTPTPEKPEAPTLTPPESLPEDAEETTNTVAETSAATKAEVGYQVSPTDIAEIKAPTITRGSLSVMLNDKVKVTKTLSNGDTVDVEAEVLEDGTVKITGSLDGAASVTVNFIGRQFGDVTNDGKPDTLDAARVLQASVGLYEFSGADTFYGDVSGDGFANTLDAARILQYSVSLVDENYVTKA